MELYARLEAKRESQFYDVNKSAMIVQMRQKCNN